MELKNPWICKKGHTLVQSSLERMRYRQAWHLQLLPSQHRHRQVLSYIVWDKISVRNPEGGSGLVEDGSFRAHFG